jgi:rSAM/selenodomain-associated transferase 1
MSLARHLVIFARAPRLGAVKRRLARDVGALAAWRFHRETTGTLLHRLGRDPRWTTWLAVTPDRWARQGRGLWRTPVRRLAQGPGDLGARMGWVFERLPPGPVVIVGSDVPGITPAAIARAFRRLGNHDWVLGPARDGGYWLIGARRRPVLRLPFQGVRWGSPHARADTLANLQGHKVALLEPLDDVDTGTDLARLKRRRPRAPSAGA